MFTNRSNKLGQEMRISFGLLLFKESRVEKLSQKSK